MEEVLRIKGRSGTPAPRVSSLVGGERSTGVPGRSSRGAAVGGRTVRLDSCSGREPFVPAGQPLVGGLCDTGVRGFRSYGKSSGGGVGVPCYCSSVIILSYLILSYLILSYLI